MKSTTKRIKNPYGYILPYWNQYECHKKNPRWYNHRMNKRCHLYVPQNCSYEERMVQTPWMKLEVDSEIKKRICGKYVAQVVRKNVNFCCFHIEEKDKKINKDKNTFYKCECDIDEDKQFSTMF